MLILVGASASGKTEVAKLLFKKYGLIKAITHTTRPKREHEKNGVDYYFVSKTKFLELLDADYFVEHTEYNGNYYGCSKKEISDNKVVIVDANGLKSFKALNDSKIITFLLYADEETRLNRMIARGDKLIDAQKRIDNDRKDFAFSNIGKTNFVIDSSKDSAEEVAETVYKKYLKALR
jgi:guanylate kinase